MIEAVVLIGAVSWLLWVMGKQIVGYRADQAAIRAKEMRAIATQADREHRLVLAGDERGIYGKYPPAKL